jgi:hypothetical protein
MAKSRGGGGGGGGGSWGRGGRSSSPSRVRASSTSKPTKYTNINRTTAQGRANEARMTRNSAMRAFANSGLDKKAVDAIASYTKNVARDAAVSRAGNIPRASRASTSKRVAQDRTVRKAGQPRGKNRSRAV